MPKVIFQYRDGTKLLTDAAAGERLMDVARAVGIPVDAPCNGNGLCGKCRMRLITGSLESAPSRHLSQEEYAEGWRLSCESRIVDDVVVEVPEAASAFQQGIRTADLSDPKVRSAFDALRETLAGDDRPLCACELHLEAPSLEDTRPDSDRVMDALEAELGVRPEISLTALKKLPGILRANAFCLRVVMDCQTSKVLDLFAPHDGCRLLGVAIDIGTTTVSGVLADLESGEPLAQISAGNGQIPYGADVINRIIESTRDGGRERLRRAIVEETLVPLVDTLCAQAGEDKTRIYRLTVAGNTTMEHLLLGLEADPIRMEPYIPAFFALKSLRAAEVIPGLHPEAALLLTPNVGSYVGGDITAGVFAAGLHETEKTTLFIDLGTNGELVIGNQEYLMCCACSAGPAFEGGDISCGMRATNGAVEAVTVDRDSMEPTMTVIGATGEKPRGLCGSGLIDLAGALFRAGIISPKGKFIREGKRVRFDEHGMGRYVFAFPEESADGKELALNEVDLDNLMRAKGAIFSAICLLLGQLGLEMTDVEEILIAGGIGGGINFRSAISIGMLPDVPEERFRYVGNSSLSGAYAALLSQGAEAQINKIGKSMMYVELSSEPGYMDEFIAACFFPHTNRSLFPSV